MDAKMVTMAEETMEILKRDLGNAVTGCHVSNVGKDDDHQTFAITFRLYDYFWIRLSYDKGSLLMYILENSFRIASMQAKWDEIDFSDFLNDFCIDVRLRIPDKYLEAKGWLFQ